MMQIPLEITFIGLERSGDADRVIRERIAALEALYERMTSCRVRVERRARDTTGSIPPVVHIEISIPGRKDIIVSHEPDHLLRKYVKPDLHSAINEAFRIASRQLIALKEQVQGRTKEPLHDTQNQRLGQIAEITPEADFGFLLTGAGTLLYFHRDSLLTGTFEDLRRGEEVFYVEAMGESGPAATKLRVKARAGSPPATA